MRPRSSPYYLIAFVLVCAFLGLLFTPGACRGDDPAVAVAVAMAMSDATRPAPRVRVIFPHECKYECHAPAMTYHATPPAPVFASPVVPARALPVPILSFGGVVRSGPFPGVMLFRPARAVGFSARPGCPPGRS